MNPPLRSNKDRFDLIKGIKSGIIDIIATDHAPHSLEEKNKEIDKSVFGIIGSEFAFSLLYTKLVLTNLIKLQLLIDLFTKNVANIFNLKVGILEENKIADLAIIDLNKFEIITQENIISKSKNTPYLNQKIYGITMLTICEGKIVYCHKEFIKDIGGVKNV